MSFTTKNETRISYAKQLIHGEFLADIKKHCKLIKLLIRYNEENNVELISNYINILNHTFIEMIMYRIKIFNISYNETENILKEICSEVS
jgi:hypothetical protein